MPGPDDVLRQIASAFAGVPRPEHFTNHTHCCECAEHDDTLRLHTPETIGLSQLSPSWDPICFATLDAYLHYLPGLARLAFGRGPDYYLEQFVFHLRPERMLAFDGAQRRAVLALLRHFLDEALDDVEPYDLDPLDQRARELASLEALAGVPADVRGAFHALRHSLDDAFLSRPAEPATDAHLTPALRAQLEREHRIERWETSGGDYLLEVASRRDPARRWRATRHELLAADGAGWRSLGGYLYLDGVPLGDTPLAP
jgi:hypothetical protein